MHKNLKIKIYVALMIDTICHPIWLHVMSTEKNGRIEAVNILNKYTLKWRRLHKEEL